MSSQNPRSPGSRRRIAGERRPLRPERPADPAPAGTGVPPSTPAEPAGERPAARKVSPARPTGSGAAVAVSPTGPSWRLITLIGVLALVFVVVAAVLGLGVWSYGTVREHDQVAEATRSAPSAAERAAATILSYNYKSLDADRKASERYMTPSYRKKYSSTFQKLVRPNAGKVRARVKAEVQASGVSHADPDRVTVLVFVDQTTTSTANSGEPQQALNRVMLSMKQVGDSWLVDNITSY